VERAPCVAIGDNTVQTNLVEIGCLELQHLKDTGAVDLIRCLSDLGIDIVATESRCDQLLAVLVKKLECGPVAAGRDLDQLCKAVSDLCFWECLEEREVEEGVHRGVVSSESVLVVAVVDGDLDADAGVDQANDGGGDTDVVGGPSVGRACKSRSRVNIEQATLSGQSALEISFTQQRRSPNLHPTLR
jgi:hypothetical protein